MRLLIFTLGFLFFQISYSQETERTIETDTIAGEEERVSRYISFFQAGATYMAMDFEDLNTRLGALGLPASFDNSSFLFSAGMNVGGSSLTDVVNAKILVGVGRSENEYDNMRNVSLLTDWRVDLNYNFYHKDRHMLYGLLGFGWTNLNMTITDISNPATDFDEAIGTFSDQTIKMENLYYLSLGGGYKFLFSDFFLNLETGYRFSLNSGTWKSSSADLINGPSLNAGAFYLSAYIGFQN